MTNQPPENDILKAWQTQAVEPLAMSVQEIRDRAGKFETKVKRRNLREYVAAVAVILWFGGYVVIVEDILVRLGSLLIVAGSVYVMLQLHRRGSAGRLPEEAGLLPSIDFYRSELVRQRDLLKGVWSWYIGPFLPGTALVYLGAVVNRPEKILVTGVSALVFCSLLLFVGAINRRAARKLQERVDELDGLRNGEASC